MLDRWVNSIAAIWKLAAAHLHEALESVFLRARRPSAAVQESERQFARGDRRTVAYLSPLRLLKGALAKCASTHDSSSLLKNSQLPTLNGGLKVSASPRCELGI